MDSYQLNSTNIESIEATSDYEAPNSSILESLRSSSSIPVRSRRPRTSPIWDYTSFNHRDDIVLNTRNKSIWRCKYCLQEYVERGGTAIIFQHLLGAHEVLIKTSQGAQKERIDSNIQDAFARVAQSGEHKRRRLDSTITTQSLDPDVLERLYISWLTRCGIPFRMVEVLEFQT